jgi:hypothetical protein
LCSEPATNRMLIVIVKLLARQAARNYCHACIGGECRRDT